MLLSSKRRKIILHERL